MKTFGVQKYQFKCYRMSRYATIKKIPGYNSAKKLVEWLRAQSAGLRKSVRVSGCHEKKQEVDFDLLCRSVPRTDRSCNQFSDFLF